METATKRKSGQEPVRVSVIMGVYNQMDREALNDAVDSILAQTMQDFEFIIYDDGSVPRAAEYIRQLSAKDDRIRVVGQKENHGLAFSLNECARLARGRYVARMDADDISRRDRLEVQCRFMDNHPDMDWCGSNALLFDKNSVWGSRKMPAYPQAGDYLRFSPYIHPSVMYRRELLEKYHYSTEKSMLRCEDYEIFMRLYRKGYHGYNIQKNLLYYREDMNSYARRGFPQRMNEAKLRYHNFKEMGILLPKGWIFVLRPILGAFVPNQMIAAIKRKESSKNDGTGKSKAPLLQAPDQTQSRSFKGSKVLSEGKSGPFTG